MNSERLRGSEAKPRFDVANPPLSEMAQRARDAARAGNLDPLIDLASEMVAVTSPGRMISTGLPRPGYDIHRQTYNGVPIRDLVDRGEWPLVKDGA